MSKRESALMVENAWDFARIESRWADVCDVINHLPSNPTPKALHDWAWLEFRTWRDLCAVDPFLPRSLWPEGYDPRPDLQRRRKVLAEASHLAASCI
jgi:hypothetical protein